MNTGGNGGGGMKVEDDGKEKETRGKTAIIYPIEWMSIHEHKVNPIILHYFICLLFMYAYVCICVCVYFSLIKIDMSSLHHPFYSNFTKTYSCVHSLVYIMTAYYVWDLVVLSKKTWLILCTISSYFSNFK